ncbi:MAG: polysaccharide biosynthesis protein [Planctomycetota bacterium]
MTANPLAPSKHALDQPVQVPLPLGPRTLLIGTARSIRQLAHALALAEPRPRLLACLLPSTSLRAEATGPSGQTMPCPVAGNLTDLDQILTDVMPDQVLVSLPLAMREAIGRTSAALQRADVTWRFMPTLGDQLAGRTTSRSTGGLPANTEGGGFVSAPIDPTRLIDRRPRPLDQSRLAEWIGGRTVMITGAGGSIGSELARIVARYRPARLLLVERGENALFEIDREIARVYPDLERTAILHDVTLRQRTFDVLAKHKPDIVLHAAAHKHVPMMEDHPAQAVENNFYGTRAIADAAAASGVGRFVMISTDKAVNPSSVMGATKRLAELYIQHLNTTRDTTCCMVRFGNVLGSACSVIPIWTRQLEHGGPITVTHPDMTRYFMTIPEAAGLVLQAGCFSGVETSGDGGEVFLLDMGEPVRILDLAERFVKLQGFEPNVDIEIKITGTRPGEKLFEELAYHGEDMVETPHDAIRVWKTTPPKPQQIEQTIANFDALRNNPTDPQHAWANASGDAIVEALRKTVPEMMRKSES